MAVSSLLPYIVASTHKGDGAAASACELRSSMDGAQILERTKLVRAMGCLQMTLTQVLGKCKSVCTCLPFALFALSLLPRGIELPKAEQVSMDPPIVEFPCRFGEGVESGRRPQEDRFQPDWKGFNWLGCSAWLSIDFDDVGGVARTVVFGEAGNCALLQLFDPFDLALEAVADVNGEPGVFGVEDVSLRAVLEGVGVGLDQIFESDDTGIEF